MDNCAMFCVLMMGRSGLGRVGRRASNGGRRFNLRSATCTVACASHLRISHLSYYVLTIEYRTKAFAYSYPLFFVPQSAGIGNNRRMNPALHPAKPAAAATPLLRHNVTSMYEQIASQLRTEALSGA